MIAIFHSSCVPLKITSELFDFSYEPRPDCRQIDRQSNKHGQNMLTGLIVGSTPDNERQHAQHETTKQSERF
jgi:hypothetical protein